MSILNKLIEKTLMEADASSTRVNQNINNLMLQEDLNRFDQTGVMYSNPNPEFYGAEDPVLSAIGGATGTRSLLDMTLKKYGSKAFKKIRDLIDYERAIAMSHPEKAHWLGRGLERMISVVEPNREKQKGIYNLINKEDMEEWTTPFAKKVLKALSGSSKNKSVNKSRNLKNDNLKKEVLNKDLKKLDLSPNKTNTYLSQSEFEEAIKKGI